MSEERKFNKTIVNIHKVDFSYTKRQLFTNLNLTIALNERVGLIGSNGIGKSTLFNLIRGTIKPDHGQIQTDGQINYIPQIDDSNLVDDAQSAGQKRLELIENTIWLPGSLLLLDEPTVYLDEKNIHNLLYLLKNYDGSILVASHDLEFINHLCQRVIILHPHQVIDFPGNYTQYLSQQKIERQKIINFNNQREITAEKINDKISTLKQKSHDYNNWHGKKNVQIGRYPSRSKDAVQRSFSSRVKRAERELKKLPAAEEYYEHRLHFPKFNEWPSKERNYEIKIPSLVSPRGKTLLQDVRLDLQTGEIVGLVGPNGAGKTTLLKYLQSYINKQKLMPQATYIGLRQDKYNTTTVIDYFKDTILSKTEIKKMLVKLDIH